MNDQIILYTTKDGETIVDVKLENENVWLTQKQMAELFSVERSVITKHIKNIYNTLELGKESTRAKNAQVRKEGARTIKRNIDYYNLDMIVSVGYRVNSKRGTQFRIWANTILKKYLIKGYVLNEKRLQEESEKLLDLQKAIKRLDKVEQNQIESDKKFEQLFKALEDKSIKPKQGIFYDGEIFDAYVFVADLIKSAETSILLIDNYVDESVLQLFTKRKKSVTVTIYTKNLSKVLKQDLEKHNAQYPLISIKKFTKSHDRFLIIDQTTVYHFGASLKDLGKRWFAFSKMDIKAMEMITKVAKQ